MGATTNSIISPGSQLAASVEVGPFCFIGPDVQIGEGTKLISHVSIMGHTTIGKGCTIYPNSVIGGPAQELNADPSKAALLIGDKVTIREGVTISTSTMGKDKPTRIGNGCYIMANVHIAHDCQLDEQVRMVQGVGLAGHVVVRKGATLSGLAGVHQFVEIGEYSFVAAGAMVSHDVLPYSMVQGNRAKTAGLNVVGLRRMGWTDARVASLQKAMAEYFRTGEVQPEDESGDSRLLLAFAKESKRGVCMPDLRTKERLSKI